MVFLPTECEHLIRRMLVLDPSKRLTIAQIKEHKWMLVEVPAQRPVLYPPGQENEPSIGEYNEQVLRLMHSLGIDQQKTIEVKHTPRVSCTITCHRERERGGKNRNQVKFTLKF